MHVQYRFYSGVDTFTKYITLSYYFNVVGESDGVANGKRYFNCSRPHAVFVEIDRVTLTVPMKVNFVRD